jgi:hypothetical protein
LRERIYGLALGYEDLNDYDSLRKDLLWQATAERKYWRKLVLPCKNKRYMLKFFDESSGGQD